MAASRFQTHVLAAFIAPALLVAAAVPATAQAQNAAIDGPSITVVGEGETAIAPDMAVISLNVVSGAETARGALDSNNETMQAVIGALTEDGIAERDIQTSNFSINPRYVYPEGERTENEGPRIVGYEVVNGLTVRIRDIASLGEVLDASVSLGVNSGGDIRFTNSDPAEAEAAARAQAVDNARARAETLAEAAGAELGRVLLIEEMPQSSAPQPMMRMEAVAADSSVPIARGENRYGVTVRMRFALEEARER